MKICGLGYVEELKMLVETFIGGLSCVKQVLMLIVVDGCDRVERRFMSQKRI